MGLLSKLFGDYSSKEIKRIRPTVDKVLSYEEAFSRLTDDELKGKTAEFKERIANGESLDSLLPEAFAVCREASWRVLGMKHFPVQIMGGTVLHQGRIAEMKTGEGKTLVATLPAYLNALTGEGVHIVTVNDYLARRDSEWMGKVYRFLGLTVGLIVNGSETEERRKAYAADITYGTNNEMGFDYLRDNMVQYMHQKVQRGHNFAVVDEVDSILIDEARTPLIISGMGGRSSELYSIANTFVKGLRCYKIAETDSKADLEELAKETGADFIVDEKARTATLTKSGIVKAEKFFNVENLSDPDNLTLSHHINIAIRAHGIMTRDIDYVVKDGEVLIVDEFTGRIMIGRRYNDGLHQAIEAKENVKIARENKTLATITFQNYFRLYKKLSGMTGTAMTEVNEFREIYSLDAVEVPTNKPQARVDNNDVIYQTEQFKFNAIIEQILKCHEKGQPVLVGTISIEKSEKLSAALKKRGIKHNVLNAKHHEKEAEIVAQAGKLGAVTIATNMAGRGTDIMLGGNAEFLAKSEMRRLEYTEELIAEATAFGETDNEDILEARAKFKELEAKYKAEIADEADQVRAAGGLYIIGTERHDSRRIDNQLRGRSGRQGDPGESRFYLSLQDDLMRLFSSDRIMTMMDTLGLDEDTPIDAKILSGAVENAQRSVESRNFRSRKNVLEYDNVMNTQREVIYAQRQKVLDGEDLKENMMSMLQGVISSTVADCLGANGGVMNDDGRKELLSRLGGIYFAKETQLPEDGTDAQQVTDILYEKAAANYQAKEMLYGSGTMRELERVVMLRVVDEYWMDNIDAMDDLKQGIGLRAYGQHDPVIAYKEEGYEMFQALITAIREETVRRMFTVQLRPAQEVKRVKVAKETVASGTAEATVKKQPVRNAGNKIGPNDPCPCGSGKKYKKCCRDKDIANDMQ